MEKKIIEGWISAIDLAWFESMREEARTRSVKLHTFPKLKNDVYVQIKLGEDPSSMEFPDLDEVFKD